MTVFADTFALIAWLNPQDSAHSQVAAYLNSFTGRLLTTDWVLVEFADALSAPSARSSAVAFLRAVRADPQFEIIGNSRDIFEGGFSIFANRPDKGWSLTDCISFDVMNERKLTDALTADQHFVQAGFRAVFK
jgi:predicted nucleic acid-binding protein